MTDEQPTTTATATIEVRLSSDKLRLLVTVPDPHGNLDLMASRIAMELPPLELAEPPDPAAIAALLAEACAPGENLADHVLLEGTAPVPPRDGTLTWAREFFAEGFEVDVAHDRMDYWERAEQRAVHEGEELAVLSLPLDGVPGINLQGDEISVDKPRSDRLRAGKGVRTVEDEDRIVYNADVAGRLTLKDGAISVDNLYSVPGDVSIATGNIHHTGAVVIGGDVCEGARIEVDGDILVKGMVEPSTISCGGNLVVGGGIVGDDEHEIEVAGSVQARYLNEVTLRCGGDLLISGQIDHCDVATEGKVEAPRGRIAGGKCMAYRGGKIGQAGAVGSTGTEIAIGASWRHEQGHEQRRKRLIKLQDARDKLSETILRAAQQGALDDDRRQSVLSLQAKLEQVDQALHAEVEAQNEAANQVIAGAHRELAILETTFPGVVFRIGTSTTTSDRQYDLPRLVALRRDKVRILPLGELNLPE